MVIDPSDPNLSPGVRAWLENFERDCRAIEEQHKTDVDLPIPEPSALEFDIRSWDKLSVEGCESPGL
jgi:hypothetical protein